MLKLTGDKPHIAIERLTIANGASREGGGGIYQANDGALVVREVVFANNRSDGFGGGAVLASKGKTLLDRCRIEGSRGPSGAALVADYVGQLVVRGTLITGNHGKSSIIYVHIRYGRAAIERRLKGAI